MKTTLIVILFFLCSQLLSQINKQDKIKHDTILQNRLNPDSNIFKQFTAPPETAVNEMVLESGFQLLDAIGQTWNVSNWLNDVKMNYYYDMNNRISEVIIQNFDSLVWQNEFKDISIYDGNNNLIESIRQQWDGSQWINYWRYVFSFDENNNLIEEKFQLKGMTSDWANIYKYVYTYDENRILKEKQAFNWDGLDWVTGYYAPNFTYSYNGNNDLVEELHKMWDGSNWIDFSRFLYSYDGNNNLIENIKQIWVDSNWENESQVTYTYDTNNNLTEELNQTWGGSDWFSNSDDNKLIYTYDTNYNLIEELTQLFSYQSWVDRYKYVYSYTLVSGIELDSEENISYSLSNNYPNPFNPSTKIEYRIKKTEFVLLKVYDVLGREVAILINREQPHGNYEVEFDASNFTSGIYFYRIQAGEFVDTKKMILLK